MGMIRTIERNMARNRMKDAGYDKVNRRMGMTAGNGRMQARAAERDWRGRKNSRKKFAVVAKIRESDPPIWKRILWGDLEKKTEDVRKKEKMKRALANQVRKLHHGEAWQTIQKGATAR